MSELLDFCLINEAIREADSIERLKRLGEIILREIELGYSWTLDAENVEWLRKEWATRKRLIEQERGGLNLQRPRYVSDRLKVRR